MSTRFPVDAPARGRLVKSARSTSGYAARPWQDNAGDVSLSPSMRADSGKRPVGRAIDVATARADRLRQPDGPRQDLGSVHYSKIVHFAHTDVLGERRVVHAKVATWGKSGAKVIDRDGNEYRVPYSHMAPGLHHSVKREEPPRA